MASIAIGWFNYVTRVGATFSLGSWEPFLPLSNVVDLDWRYVAQSLDYLAASTKFSFTFTQEYPIGMIHVGGIQSVGFAIGSATMQVRAYNTAAVLQYDSGVVQVWNGTQTEWDSLARSKFFVFPSDKNIKTVNVDFFVPVSATNKIQVGCVGAYNVFWPRRNVAYGWGIGYTDTSTVDRIPGGSPFITRRGIRRKLNFSLPWVSVTQDNITTFESMAAHQGKSSPYAIVLDPSEAPLVNERHSIYGFESSDPEWTNPFFAYRALTMSVDQV